MTFSPLADPLVNALFLAFPNSAESDALRKRLLPVPAGQVITLESPVRPMRESEKAKAMLRPTTRGISEPTLASILREVSERHGVSVELLRGHRRHKNIVNARFEYYFRAVTETSKSLPTIARACNKDHSSVIHGVQKICREKGLNYYSQYQKGLRETQRDENGNFISNRIIGFTPASVSLDNR